MGLDSQQLKEAVAKLRARYADLGIGMSDETAALLARPRRHTMATFTTDEQTEKEDEQEEQGA